MRDALGDRMVAVAQERHRVEEFEAGQTINAFEEKQYSKDEYDARVMDTTVNYFYALYILSKCDGFICSGQNNGWDMVLALNEGRFEKTYRFSLGI